MKHYPLTRSDITGIYQEFEELDQIWKELNHILKYGRQHSLFDSMDDYCRAKEVTLDIMRAIRRRRKDILKGAFKTTR